MPSGESSWTQLLASNRRRHKGDLGKLQAKLWFALEAADAGLKVSMQADDHDGARKWAHVISQLGTTYIKAVIDGELESRVAALENLRQQISISRPIDKLERP